MSKTPVLYASEAEAYVQSLETFDLTDIGSSKWLQQHEYVEKLNMQALCNAFQNEDEFVKEFLITYEKIPVLVYDAITTEIWKNKIFPKIMISVEDREVVFPFYFILHHEVTVVNLLETVLFHQSACETLNDLALDLVDYCYGKLAKLLAIGHYCEDADKNSSENLKNLQLSSVEELKKQHEKLNFAIAVKSLAILRFMIDNMKVLSLSFAKRVLNILDVPILLVELIENPPWVCNHAKSQRKYDGANWLKSDHPEFHKLTKVEGQVWIALFQLLITETRNNYEFNSFRKSALLRLRPYLNDLLLDQMPILIEMQRFLDQLSFCELEQPKNALILEQLPEIKESCMRKHKGKWEKIAEHQKCTFFNTSSEEFQALAKNLSETYSFDNLENFIEEPPKCVFCGDAATKRCSRCQNEWYCRRECQVKHWPKHKTLCDLMQPISVSVSK